MKLKCEKAKSKMATVALTSNLKPMLSLKVDKIIKDTRSSSALFISVGSVWSQSFGGTAEVQPRYSGGTAEVQSKICLKAFEAFNTSRHESCS
jgi:hypothetical protein